MGFLDNDTVIVDAILTKHGRRKLAEGNSLGITKFALSDDGVDYSLWNVDHPSGSAFYGEAIENMPLIEVAPDDSTLMKYKLMDLPRNTRYFPVLKGFVDSYTLIDQKDKFTIEPITDNFGNSGAGGGSPESYIWKISNEDSFNFFDAQRKDIGPVRNAYPAATEIPQPAQYGPSKKLTIQAKPTKTQKTITIMFEGVQSGVVGTVSVTANKNVSEVPK
tara:strand:- start:35 stop:691 length:657 start_codon:yes stop_codon:yes gene_type:complete